MNFKLTHFLFIFSFLLMSNSYALDLYVNDSYVSSRVKYTLSNDNRLDGLKLLLLDPNNNQYIIREFNGIDLSKQSYEDYISQIYFNKPGKYTLKAMVSDKILTSDTFNVSVYNPYKSQAIGGDANLILNKSTTPNLFAVLNEDSKQDQPLLGIENPRFEFDILDDSIKVDEFLTFTVKALDSDGNLDTSYLGEIEFEVIDDENVTLPDAYKFEEDDAGIHNFATAISFSTPGNKIIKVVDVDDAEIIAAFEVEVLESKNTQEDQNSSVSISLETPTSGVTNLNVIEFKGKTSPGKEVKIFENNTLLISLGSDSNGNFQFISPPFADGDYEFFAQIDNVKSDVVSVEVKTQAAILDDFIIAPESVRPLKKYNLELTFTDRVSTVSVVIDGKKFDLEAVDDTSTKFFAELVAPVLSGDYNVSIVYNDFQGISNTFLLPEKLIVLEPEITSVNDTEEINFNVNQTDLDGDFNQNSNQNNQTFVSDAVFIPPSNVTGVQIIPDDNKVQLNWLPASDNTGIAFYLIRFGIDPSLLDSELKTFDSTTAFTIEQLPSDMQFYFSIFAVDIDGNLSRQGSNILSAVPQRSITSSFGANLNGSIINPVSNDVLIDPDQIEMNQDLLGVETPEVGPSENLAILSLMLSFLIGLILRRKGWSLF